MTVTHNEEQNGENEEEQRRENAQQHNEEQQRGGGGYSNDDSNNQTAHNFLGIQKQALVRLAVCVFTLWLIVLLLSLMVVVGMYTSQANQILVVSSVAMVSIALVVASCKLNSIAGLSKMVKEEVAAKEDPPPTYDDVLHSESPPPSYFAVVNESGFKEGTHTRPEISPSPKQTSSLGNRGNPAFRSWLGRPGILNSVMFRASRRQRPTATTSTTHPVKVPAGSKGPNLRRSSSTPSLTGVMAAPLPLTRCPSTPSLRL